MGGVVSTGVDNDELVDNLKEADYIRTPIIEKVFRLVDRADYITLEDKKMAYRDSAWRSGNLHLSAPCIYAQAMEGLQITEGMSFLNIGSGTGYLSTMAGLLLGPKGTSHGIELHSDVIEYAHERLDWFKTHSGALDVLEFCEPIFIQGNAFCLPDDRPLYDRVYCGASCNDSHEKFMKQLLKVGGVLVMPLNDQLLKVTRTGQTDWHTESLLPVTFSPLVIPDLTHPPATLNIPPALLNSLQDLCRREIRRILHYLVEQENPELKQSFVHKVECTRNSRSEYPGGRMLFSEMPSDPEDVSDTSDNADAPLTPPYDSHRQVVDYIFELRSRSLASRRYLSQADHGRAIRKMPSRSNRAPLSPDKVEEAQDECDLLTPQVDIEMAEAEKPIDAPSSTEQEQNIDESDQGLENSLSDDDYVSSKETEVTLPDCSNDLPSTSQNTKISSSPINEDGASSSDCEPNQTSSGNEPENSTKMAESASDEVPTSSALLNEKAATISPLSFSKTVDEEDSLSSHSTCSNSSNKRSREPESSHTLMELEEPKKREKFDSGVGDELEGDAFTSPGDSTEGEERESDSDDSDSLRIPAFKVFSLLAPNCSCRERKGFPCNSPRHQMRRKRAANAHKTEQQKEEDADRKARENPVKKYSSCMQEKIHQLPLPLPMKVYINYNRDM